METAFNPLTRECAEIQRQIESLMQSQEKAESALQWFASLDESVLAARVVEGEDAAQRIRHGLHSLECDI